MVFQQEGYQVRFEWGYEGVRTLAPVSDIVVIIDVLSFTTCVDVVVGRGGIVFPYRHRDDTAIAYADHVNALLAGKRGEAISLSPASLQTIEKGSRIVLPSPNGSTCTVLAKDSGATVIAGCLRNASAVAGYIREQKGIVSMIACGERWADGSLRPAIEDMLAAGAIISELQEMSKSPEALLAEGAFNAAGGNLSGLLEGCSSGQELITSGYGEDVKVASTIHTSKMVPILSQDGAYQGGMPS
ncbi:2-phosphosulfolactate phosphatase [Brevibacillus migulae]|uniref:2-phosphosulfolactate phosphatase n=1 Tax=Brevibacillus migulae TaxID=1644114 RepID=UPI00106E74C0|nr:2-phosphosulfolactate phosphatase [Brevibacillus migulae]